MMKLVCALALVASCAAFAPTAGVARASARSAAVDEMMGGGIETAGVWDPLNLGAQEDKLFRRRLVEIKHGRVAMLAVVGFIAPEFLRLPGYLDPAHELAYADIPNGWAAIEKVPTIGWLQILAFCGFLETAAPQRQGGRPGEMDTPHGWKYTAEETDEKLLVELKNGRLAMIGITGMMVQSSITGQGIWEQMYAGNHSPF